MNKKVKVASKKRKETQSYLKAYGQTLVTDQEIKGLIPTSHSGMVAPKPEKKKTSEKKIPNGYWMYESNLPEVKHIRENGKHAYITGHKKKSNWCRASHPLKYVISKQTRLLYSS